MLFIDIFRLLEKLVIPIKCSGNKRRIPVIGMFLLKQQRERRQKNIFVGGSDIRWRVGVIRELRMVLSLD